WSPDDAAYSPRPSSAGGSGAPGAGGASGSVANGQLPGVPHNLGVGDGQSVPQADQSATGSPAPYRAEPPQQSQQHPQQPQQSWPAPPPGAPGQPGAAPQRNGD